MNRLKTSEIDSFIVCQNRRGEKVRATLLKLTRYRVVFEVYNPYGIFQSSEVLSDFKIIMNDQTVYSGRAVVSSLINTGTLLLCEASLGDFWQELDFLSALHDGDKLQERFAAVKEEWEEVHHVIPDFKVVIADMQMLFSDLRQWLDQVEAAIHMESEDAVMAERRVVKNLQDQILSTVGSSFERFEVIAGGIKGEAQAFYRAYAKRQLHSWLLCSPFVERVFHKPLGYAGDYEMVNMLLRDPLEGRSLYAKLINLYFLTQRPAEAHRNRIVYLTERLIEETSRMTQQGGIIKILSIGCGPAKEVQDFLAQDDQSEMAEFTLLDFDDEVLSYTGALLDRIKEGKGRTTSIQMIKKSVQQLIREMSKTNGEWNGTTYDFIYCAGLFDYLSDRICKRLMNIFYSLLTPGGLLVATNVDASNPIRSMMELILEWHLVYRNAKQLESLAPDSMPLGHCRVKSDPTGVNIFIEVRKSEDA